MTSIIAPLENLMTVLLQYLIGVTGNSGLGIIVLTLLIRIVLYPLTLSQTRSLQMMKQLQPQLQEIQKKYKDKPEEMQKRMMALYRDNKVNPLGGCLLMLVQLPFLWAIFLAVQGFAFPDRFFVWDLASKDPYYVFPILAAVTTAVQSLMTVTDPQQRTVMLIMPIMIGVFSVNFPTGVVIYWVTSNLFSIGQQYLILRQGAVARGGSEGK